MYSVRLFRWFIVLAVLSFSGVLLTQLYWLNLAFNQKQKEFEQKVIISLNLVVREVLKHNGTLGIPDNPVLRQSANYFEAKVNDRIEPDVLKYFLNHQFQKIGIDLPYSFAVYDCASNQMLFGGTDSEVLEQNITEPDFPKSVYHNNYFSVFFPSISQNLFMELGTWLYFTALVCVILIFFIYSFFLITRQRQMEEMQKAFINNMAHELRTPLTAISMSAEQLQGAIPNAKLLYLNIIHQESKKLKTQLERVLSLNRKFPYKMELVSVNPWIQNLVSQWELAHQALGVKVYLTLPSTSPTFMGDQLHLDQAMSNLFENTLKYAKQEPLEINISIEMYKQTWRLQFYDNGNGVLPHELKYLFKPFFRASNATTELTQGFGLGLSYVSQVVKAHRGKVKAMMTDGGGLMLEIEVPLIHA